MVLLLTFIYSSGTLRGTDEDWRVLLRTFIWTGGSFYLHSSTVASALSGNRGDSEGPDSCYLLSSSSGTLWGKEQDQKALLLTFTFTVQLWHSPGTEEIRRVLLLTFIQLRYSLGNRVGSEGPVTYFHLAPALSGNREDSEGPDSCYLLSSSAGTLRGTEEDQRVLLLTFIQLRHSPGNRGGPEGPVQLGPIGLVHS